MVLVYSLPVKYTVTSKKHLKSVKTTILKEWVRMNACITNLLGKFYLINAPWGFSTVWSVIKPWLDPVTVEKIAILGTNYQPILLAQIPAENLPSQFGGLCRCPGGCELSDEGPWQDPQWLAPQENTDSDKAKEQASTESTKSEPISHSGDIDAAPKGSTLHTA
jgi:CRAL/TRIO domain